MPLKAHSVWHALRALTTAIVLSAGLCPAQAQAMTDGIAVVTSEQGAIQITDENGHNFSPNLHQTLLLNGSRIQTGEGAHLFMALSNGVGVGIKGNSEVVFESYQQRPFSAKQQSIRHEPSKSELSLQITQGTIALAGNRLSPISELLVDLPSGTIRIHSANCVVQRNDLETVVTACDKESTFTYYSPNKTTREFFVGPERLRLNEANGQVVLKTESMTPATLPEECQQLAAATQQASQRVFFKATAPGETPQPVLIVSPDYFEQPAARPYQFNE
jgi:hypothetical protein